MILINQAEANTIVVTLKEKQTLVSPYWLFVFTQEQQNKNYAVILTDVSTTTRRYNEFTFNEGTDLDLVSGNYDYFIYEQASAVNLDPALADNLCERGKAFVNGQTVTDNFYTPSDEENNIYDYPYLINELGQVLTDENDNELTYV